MTRRPGSHREYLYISNRLTRELVESATATTRSRRILPGLSLRGLALSVTQQEPAWDNQVEMAKRATKALSDQDLIGPLDPEARSPYIQATLPLDYGVLRVHNPGFDLGLLTADTETEWGRTLILLVGSPSNFRNRRGDPPSKGDWTPSDADGLMEIIQTVIEDNDRERFDEWDWDDEPIPDAVLDAAETFRKEARLHHRGELEFIAKVHHQAGHVRNRQRDNYYGLVLVGAALWAATPDPKALPLV